MPRGFRWNLCNYVGGDYAVKPSFKPYLVLRPDAASYTGGTATIVARDTTPIEFNLGFAPNLLILASFRPRYANGSSDSSFGNRGGGMTFGVAGRLTAPDWNSVTTYDPGDTVEHEGVVYVASNTNTNDEPPSANWDVLNGNQFSGSSRIQQGYDIPMGAKTWREDVCFNVVHGGDALYGGWAGHPNHDALTLEHEFTANGFTLTPTLNLYDENDSLYWFAARGDFHVGIMDAGDTEVLAVPFQAEGAAFFSTRYPDETDPADNWGYWDIMTGFASPDAQVCNWGGQIPTSWGWSTEYFSNQSSILIGKAASSSGLVGAEIRAEGRVTGWNANSIDLQWPIFDNEPYRIGYILSAEGEAGYLEANFLKRPGGPLADADGSNFQPTRLEPRVILMATTNYIFNYNEPDPLIRARYINGFDFGGGGGIGWHWFTISEVPALGVHTYSNSVSERGHYANSATQRQNNCIMAGAGANSNPPAAHQHGIDILPNPIIVGINYRYGERHAHVKRFHRNPSDIYVPTP